MTSDTSSDQGGKPPNISISLDVDGSLSWGELFWFVDQARKSGVDPNDDVPVAYDSHQEFAGFQCYVYPDDFDKA